MATNAQAKPSLKNISKVEEKLIIQEDAKAISSVTPVPDPQVKTTRHYKPRRTYDPAYKMRILAAYDACKTASARGELLRKEGLYHSRIWFWKHEQARGKLNSTRHKKGVKNALRVDHLLRENEYLKKKLAQAEAIIDLQKKVSDLLGTHILPQGKSEENS